MSSIIAGTPWKAKGKRHGNEDVEPEAEMK